MNKLIIGALLCIGGLGYLSVNPTPVVRALHNLTHEGPAMTPEEWLPLAAAGVAEGDPFYMARLGFGHAAVNLVADGVERDSVYGAWLVEQAMGAGYSRAGAYWYHYIDKTQDGMERAARAGTYTAISGVATQYAMTFCDHGTLPEGAMEEFLAPYLEAMDPVHQATFVPENYRERFMTEITTQYEAVVEGAVERLPEAFDDICADQESMRAMFPPN